MRPGIRGGTAVKPRFLTEPVLPDPWRALEPEERRRNQPFR